MSDQPNDLQEEQSITSQEGTPATTTSPEATEPDETISITLDESAEGEHEHAAAPTWVKRLRQNFRESQKRIKELEAKLQEVRPPDDTQLGEEPTLEGCNWDPDQFKQSYAAWHDRRKAIAEREATVRHEQEQEQEKWQQRLAKYSELKQALKAPNVDEAEAEVMARLSQTQQGIIIQGTRNPALMYLALGTNPQTLERVAQLRDPVEFTFAIAELENTMATKRKATPPPPDKDITSNVMGGGGGEKYETTLERLREEATKTGDYTKVIAFKTAARNKSTRS